MARQCPPFGHSFLQCMITLQPCYCLYYGINTNSRCNKGMVGFWIEGDHTPCGPTISDLNPGSIIGGTLLGSPGENIAKLGTIQPLSYQSLCNIYIFFSFRITSILVSIVVMYIVLVSPSEILRFSMGMLSGSHDPQSISVHSMEIQTTLMEVSGLLLQIWNQSLLLHLQNICRINTSWYPFTPCFLFFLF